MNDNIKLFNGDCLVESDKIENGSVDLILTDLPYGNMKGLAADGIKGGNNKGYVSGGGYKRGYDWDTKIDTKSIMDISNRILRKSGKLVLFAQQPYTTQLINRAIPNLPHSYNMIWEKNDFANCLLCKKAPVSFYEDIIIFSKTHDHLGLHPLREYFKKIMDFIKMSKKEINLKLGHRKAEHSFYVDSTQFSLCTEKTYNELIEVFKIDKMTGFKKYVEIKSIDEKFKKDLPSTFNLWDGKKYKSNILKYKKDYSGHHPTQKPVLLLEDLIKTFSNNGDIVLDFTMGSGSTGVACVETGRKFIGIELDESYFNIANERIHKAIQEKEF